MRGNPRMLSLIGAGVALALLLLPAASGVSGATTRVSVASAGEQANSDSLAAAISADGRFVSFYSSASNLAAGDTNNARDVFVRDRGSGATARVSIDGAGAQANSHSFAPAISGDGRFIAFYSHAWNLVVEDTNDGSDIFVHDLQSGATSRVSVDTAGVEGDGNSFRPALSGDGRLVAFDSDAWNLVPGDTNDTFDVFLHDRQSGLTTRASVDDSGGQASGASQRATLSADGRYVAFYSDASELIAGDSNGSLDVFVHDAQSGATSRVSVASAGVQGDGDSLRPVLSADGKFVAFDSVAPNLVDGDTNRFSDVFLRDLTAGPPPPPPPPAPTRCRVPRVIGLRLAAARTRIRRANCRVGRVRRARSRRVGRVLAQRPRAGVRRPRGTRVNLVVGSRR